MLYVLTVMICRCPATHAFIYDVRHNEPPPLSPHVKNNRIYPIKCVGPRDWSRRKRRVGGWKKNKKIRVEILFNRNDGALKYFVSADEVSRGSTRVWYVFIVIVVVDRSRKSESDRGVAVVVTSSISVHTSLLSAPATLHGRWRDTRTVDEDVCVCVERGGGYCHRVHYLVFFQSVFRPLFFFN